MSGLLHRADCCRMYQHYEDVLFCSRWDSGVVDCPRMYALKIYGYQTPVFQAITTNWTAYSGVAAAVPISISMRDSGLGDDTWQVEALYDAAYDPGVPIFCLRLAKAIAPLYEWTYEWVADMDGVSMVGFERLYIAAPVRRYDENRVSEMWRWHEEGSTNWWGGTRWSNDADDFTMATQFADFRCNEAGDYASLTVSDFLTLISFGSDNYAEQWGPSGYWGVDARLALSDTGLVYCARAENTAAPDYLCSLQLGVYYWPPHLWPQYHDTIIWPVSNWQPNPVTPQMVKLIGLDVRTGPDDEGDIIWIVWYQGTEIIEAYYRWHDGQLSLESTNTVDTAPDASLWSIGAARFSRRGWPMIVTGIDLGAPYGPGWRVYYKHLPDEWLHIDFAEVGHDVATTSSMAMPGFGKAATLYQPAQWWPY